MFIGVGLVWKEVDRRSVYALLVKPIRREAFIVGKFLRPRAHAGGQPGRDDARRCTPCSRSWPGRQPALARAAAWMRRCSIANLVKVYLLIFVHLLLVTAIALFFSTFSSPMLSAAFTIGLYVVGHFNDDLAHFETVAAVVGRLRWLAKVLYYALPNLAPFDIKSAVVHGQPVSWGYVALTSALRPLLRRRRSSWWRRGSSRGVTSSDRDDPGAPAIDTGGHVGRHRGGRGVRRRGSRAPGPWRLVSYPVSAAETAALYVTSAKAIDRAALSFDALVADVYWIRALQHYGGTRLVAGRPTNATRCCTRSSNSPRASTRGSRSPTASAPSSSRSLRPTVPAARTGRSPCSRRASTPYPDSGSYAMDMGFVHYWWTTGPQDGGRLVRTRGRQHARRILVAAVDGRDHARRRRATARRRAGCGSEIYETADHDWLRNNARLRLMQFDALDQMDVLAMPLGSGTGRLRPRRPGRGPTSSLRASCVACRSIRPARLRPRRVAEPEASALAPASPLQPLPPQFTKKASPSP